MKTQIIDLQVKMAQNNQLVSAEELDTFVDFMEDQGLEVTNDIVDDFASYRDANATLVELQNRLASCLETNTNGRLYDEDRAVKIIDTISHVGEFLKQHPHSNYLLTVRHGRVYALSSNHLKNILNLTVMQNEINNFLNA